MSASEMQYPDEHQNPTLSIESESFVVNKLTVGELDVDGTVDLPSTESLTLTKDLVSLSGGATLSGNYVFRGTGTMTTPKLGDIRVSYSVLKPGFDGTVFGELSGSEVTKFTNEDDDSLFRVFEGSREEGIARLHDEYVTMGWVLRIVALLVVLLLLIGGGIATAKMMSKKAAGTV